MSRPTSPEDLRAVDQHAVRQRTTSPQLTGQADANYARYEGGGPPPAIMVSSDSKPISIRLA
jgi:hypothetical protein